MFTRRPKEKPDEPNHGATQSNGLKEKQTKNKKGGDEKLSRIVTTIPKKNH
jgi:hypothetical protein